MGESEPFHEQTKKSIEKAIIINTLYFFEGTYYPPPWTWFSSHCSKNGNGAAMRAAIALSGSQFNKTRDESIRRTCSAFLTFLAPDSSDDERRKRFFLCSSILWCVYFCCIKISEIYYSSLYFFVPYRMIDFSKRNLSGYFESWDICIPVSQIYYENLTTIFTTYY